MASVTITVGVSVTILESKLERAAVRYATRAGAESLKLNVRGRRGWPDRAFFFWPRRLVLVEFKRKGEEPTKIQKLIHRRLARLGWKVSVFDDLYRFKRWFDEVRSDELHEALHPKDARSSVPGSLPRSRSGKDRHLPRRPLDP
jgi:hypothetical protein